MEKKTIKIIADTREQKVLDFSRFSIVTEVINMKLEVADYAIQYENKYIPSIRFERKGKGDLFNSLTNDYDRFKKEIERSKDFEVSILILIENTMTDISEGYEYSKVPGDKIIKQLFTLWEKYDVKFAFCDGRNECARYIVEVGSAIGRKAMKDIKEAKRGYKKT